MSSVNKAYFKIANQHREFVEKVNLLSIQLYELFLVKDKKHFQKGQPGQKVKRLIHEISILIK